jgi:hypothetical protein
MQTVKTRMLDVIDRCYAGVLDVSDCRITHMVYARFPPGDAPPSAEWRAQPDANNEAARDLRESAYQIYSAESNENSVCLLHRPQLALVARVPSGGRLVDALTVSEDHRPSPTAHAGAG